MGELPGRRVRRFQPGFPAKEARASRVVSLRARVRLCTWLVPRADDCFVAVCACDPPECDDFAVTLADVALLELNWSRLGRGIAKAFECDPKEADLRLPGTRQVASFERGLALVLTIQNDRESFVNVVGQLVARLPERFILLAPTEPVSG